MIIFLVILLISVGLLGYWYFFDQSPIEQPQRQYTKPVIYFEAVNWNEFHNNLMAIGYIDFFQLYPLDVYAYILGVDISGLKEIYNNEERFEDLANDLAVKFEQDNVLFQMFCAEMQQFELNLSFMPIDFSFNHSGVDHHYDSAFDHNNFNNTF